MTALLLTVAASLKDTPRLPLPLDKPISRLSFGSCNKPSKPQGFWERISDRHPDIFVWLGDVHYADRPVFLKWRIPASAEQIRDGYEAQLLAPEYRRFLTAVPVEGVYDDHDYGMNDGDRTFNATARALSQQLLLDFIGEPAESQRRSQSGVYVTHEFGVAPRRVRLILLDVRFNKDVYGGPLQDFLGSEQWAWLERTLASSEAEINIIGSGLQVISRGDPWIAEMWYKLPQSQARLVSLIAKTRARGVLFLSGDVHFGELNVAHYSAVGYPLYDFTSSGLTHSWGGPIKTLAVEALLMGITRVPGVPYYTEKNWGEVDIRWGPESSPGDTMITFRLMGVDDGAVHIEYNVSLRDLQPPTSDASLEAARAAALLCIADTLTDGLSPACAAVLDAVQPRITLAHEIKYYSSHAVLIAGVLGVMSLVVTSPCLVWAVGPWVPGGRPAATAVAVLGVAVLAAFIDSIH